MAQEHMEQVFDDGLDALVIDCSNDPIFRSASDNFRITIADVARFIMELKQGEVA